MSILRATTTANEIVFSDVNPGINVDNSFALIYNEDAINKSIETILGTRKKTRVFRRNFGAYIEDILFDPIDDISVDRLKREIIVAINEHEKRVVLKGTEVLPDYANQQYYVNLGYTIPALNNKSASFAFYMARNK